MEDQEKTYVIWKLTVDKIINGYRHQKEFFYSDYQTAVTICEDLHLPLECISPIVVL